MPRLPYQIQTGWPGERPLDEGRRRNPAAEGYPAIALASIKSVNTKTGPTFATWVTQASCPSKGNNKAGYQCPLLGSACYAEHGLSNIQTTKLNKNAGVNPKANQNQGKYSPEEIAEAEAASIIQAIPEWKRKRGKLVYGNNSKPEENVFARLHVVGDCVTPAAARIVSYAADKLVEKVPGASPDVRNVWTYTHAWRTVPRKAWSSKISVLASLDCFDQTPQQVTREMEQAHRSGYAIAIVVPDYVQSESVRYGASYTLPNGFKVIPCPYEVRRRVEEDRIAVSTVDEAREAARSKRTGRQLQCIDCMLCCRDEFLRRNKAVIAFAVHAEGSAKTAVYRKKMANLLDLKPESTFGDADLPPVLNNLYDMHANDRDYGDVLKRLDMMSERGDFEEKKKGDGKVRRKSNPAGEHSRDAQRKTSAIMNYLSKHARNYYESIYEVNDLLDRAASHAGIQMADYITSAIAYDTGQSFLLGTSHPDILVHVSLYRTPSGRYELTSYPVRDSRRRRNPEGDIEDTMSAYIASSIRSWAGNHKEYDFGNKHFIPLKSDSMLVAQLLWNSDSGHLRRIAYWTEDRTEDGDYARSSPLFVEMAADSGTSEVLKNAVHYALHSGSLNGFDPGTGSVLVTDSEEELDNLGPYPLSKSSYGGPPRRRNPDEDTEDKFRDIGSEDIPGEDSPVEESVAKLDFDVPEIDDSYERAEKVYETFHGQGSDEEILVEEAHVVRESLAALGILVELTLTSPSKTKFNIQFEGDEPLLCSSTDSTQLYIIGGDQSIDDESLLQILDNDHEAIQKDKLMAGTLNKLVYRTEKDFDNFETIDYEHDLGEEGGFEPAVVYDRINRQIEIVGGSYRIKREGIVN